LDYIVLIVKMEPFRNLTSVSNCSGDSTDEENLPPPSKRPRVLYDYEYKQTFADLNSAKVFLKEQNQYVVKTSRISKGARKIYYNCKVKLCLKKVYLCLKGMYACTQIDD